MTAWNESFPSIQDLESLTGKQWRFNGGFDIHYRSVYSASFIAQIDKQLRLRMANGGKWAWEES